MFSTPFSLALNAAKLSARGLTSVATTRSLWRAARIGWHRDGACSDAGALLVAGALGVTAAQRSNTAHAAVPLPAKGATRAAELPLYARNFTCQSPTHRAGSAPRGGRPPSAYGELLDRPKGKVVGHFTAAQLTQDSPFAAAVSSLEIHTFHLEDGAIHGLGTALRGTAGSFTILGGTGRYAVSAAATWRHSASVSTAATGQPTSI